MIKHAVTIIKDVKDMRTKKIDTMNAGSIPSVTVSEEASEILYNMQNGNSQGEE